MVYTSSFPCIDIEMVPSANDASPTSYTVPAGPVDCSVRPFSESRSQYKAPPAEIVL
jgi:hypothetical protein